MAFERMALFPYRKDESEFKFCHGEDHQVEIPKSEFPKTGGRFCKNCANERLKKKLARLRENRSIMP